MHIPDGFLSTALSVILWALSVVLIGIALKRVGRDVGERQVPLMGVLAAAIFAGQMLNFAVAGGTSGHLLGATLATVLLGPWPAMVVMTSVVSIQAIVFQDGGLLALGPNLFNMAVIGVAVSHFSWSSMRRHLGSTKVGISIAASVSAWLSIVVAAIACALELAVSGTTPANLAVPAMAGIHALIGIGEAIITAGAVAFLMAARPDLLQSAVSSASGNRSVWIGGALLTLALVAAAPLASRYPDGLERVAQTQNFWASSQRPIHGLIPNYVLPGIPDQTVATILAAALGSGLVLITTLVVTHSGRRKKRS